MSQTFSWNTNFGNGGVEVIAADKPGNSDYEYSESAFELTDGKMLVALNRGSTYLERYLPNGTQDTTYQNRGRSKSIWVLRPKLYRLADNKILMVGTGYTSVLNLVVYRLLEDGTIDTNFNNGTPLRFPLPLDGMYRMQCSNLPDGRILVFATPTPEYNAYSKPVLLQLKADGTEDQSFGSSVIQLPNIPNGVYNMGMGLTGGRITTGYVDPQSKRVIVKAYTTTGSVDSSFGPNKDGHLEMDAVSDPNVASLTVLSNGQIVVATTVNFNSVSATQKLYGLLPNGEVDATFGVAGSVNLPNSNLQVGTTKLMPSATGFIYISSSFAFDNQVTLTRYNNKGIPDQGYGNKGQQTLQLSGLLEVRDVSTTTEGTTIINGRLAKIPEDFFFVSRVGQDGFPDSRWSEGGTKLGFLPTARAEVISIKPLANGSLYSLVSIVGSTQQSGLIKYTPDGKLDSSYGNKGIAAINTSFHDTLKNGGIITAETGWVYPGPYTTLILSRYRTNGTLDSSYGRSGVQVTFFPIVFSLWSFITLPNDLMIVHGALIDAQNNYRHFVCRVLPNGSIDKGFGQDGFVYFPYNRRFQAKDFHLLEDGRLLIEGTFFTPDYKQQYGLLRLLPNGKEDSSFGNNGYVSDSTVNESFSSKVLLQPGGHCIIFYNSTSVQNGYIYYRQMVGRIDSTGKRFPTFGDAILNYTYTSNPISLANGRWMRTMYDFYGSSPKLRVEVRKPDGFLDSSFANNGIQLLDSPIKPVDWYDGKRRGNRIFFKSGTYSEFETTGLIGALLIKDKLSSIGSFTLVNATTDKDIQPLTSNTTFNIADLKGRSVNIRADVSDTAIHSIVMELSGKQTHKQVESIPAYALFGNTGNDYGNWTPAPGSYTLTATPYTGIKGTGTAGTPLTISFTITDELTLSSLDLVNARTNTRIGALANGSTIDLAQTPDINIVALPGKGLTQSVVFGLNTNKNYKVENSAPYALASDNKGDYSRWNVKPGTYTITATPYPETKARGKAGEANTITINIINSAVKFAMAANNQTPQLDEGAPLQAGIFPNPTSAAATLRYSVFQNTYLNIDLLDAGGTRLQKLFSGTVPGSGMQQLTLQLSGLKAGLYYARIMTAHGKWQVVPIVKQ